eukprot:2173283-Amphidinium_carterae.1
MMTMTMTMTMMLMMMKMMMLMMRTMTLTVVILMMITTRIMTTIKWTGACFNDCSMLVLGVHVVKTERHQA